MSKEIGWCHKHRFKVTPRIVIKKNNHCQKCIYIRRYPVEYWLRYELDRLAEKIKTAKNTAQKQKLEQTVELLKEKFSAGIVIDPNYTKKKKNQYVFFR